MNKEAALEILREVCAKFVGNLNDHERIQAALQWIENELNRLIEPPKPSKPSKK